MNTWTRSPRYGKLFHVEISKPRIEVYESIVFNFETMSKGKEVKIPPPPTSGSLNQISIPQGPHILLVFLTFKPG